MDQEEIPKFIAAVEKRIAEKNYDLLFSGGCCYHFALRAFHWGIGSLARIENHAFVLVDGKDGWAFDHKGYRKIADIKEEFGSWAAHWHFPSSEAEMESKIAERGLPDSMLEKEYAIADTIIAEKDNSANRPA